MKLPQIIFFTLTVFSLNAQDSLPKTKLRFFDLNLAGTITTKESANMSMNHVKSFTKDNYYVSDDFTKGFSDTAHYNYRGGKRNYYSPPSSNPGSTYAQIGINISFKFTDAKSRFVERLKPRLGIYYSSRRFFSYNIRKNETSPSDTLFFTDPKYPPIIQSGYNDFKNINYKYTSKQVYAELGLNIDIFRRRFFMFYTGILYGYGKSFKNEFYMREDSYDYMETKPYATIEVHDKEPSSVSQRLTVPMGILVRFSKKAHFSPGFYAECSPGFESYKIKGGRTLSHPICAFTWGVRFNFQPHRSS